MQRESHYCLSQITPSRFGLPSRHKDNSNIRWFDNRLAGIFHTLNAWRTGEEVVLIARHMNGTTVLNASDNARLIAVTSSAPDGASISVLVR